MIYDLCYAELLYYQERFYHNLFILLGIFIGGVDAYALGY